MERNGWYLLKRLIVTIFCIVLALVFYCLLASFRMVGPILDLLKIYWGPITIAIVAGIVVKIIDWIFKRAKTRIAQPIQTILQRACKECDGKGYIVCKTCNGSGNVTQEVTVVGKCNVCKGSGLIKTTCPTCYGTKTINRPLRFETLTAETKVDGILFWPRTQTIMVKVRNLDEKEGKFTALVTLKDRTQSSKSESENITPGSVKDIKVTFPADRWEGYPSTYDVQAETLPFTCPTCGGIGSYSRPCITCNATGETREKKEQIEVCPTCGGRKEVLCQACKGIGKVSRF